MSYELPIVATEWRGIQEVTRNDGGACLIPIQDPVALAAMLHSLLVSPEQRKLMGQVNHKRYLAKFTLENYRGSLEHHLRLTTKRSIAAHLFGEIFDKKVEAEASTVKEVQVAFVRS